MMCRVAVLGILLAVPAKAPGRNGEEAFLPLVQKLKDDDAGPRSLAAGRLAAMGPDVLSLFFSHFEDLEDVVRNRFATEVVPHLRDDHVKEQLLSELRTGAPVARQAVKLRRGEKVEGFESTHASMESFQRAWQRWDWTLHALAATAIPEAYSELFTLYQEMQGDSGVDYKLVRALYKADPGRAVRDLEAMLRDPAVERRMQGLRMYRHLAPLIPDCKLLRTVYKESPEVAAAIADLLRHAPPRECLDLLLDLCEHPDPRVHMLVDESLRSLGHISREQLETMTQGATDPAARAKIWRTWWDESGGFSGEKLRLRGCQETFGLADGELSQQICASLRECGDQAETYKILEKGILSDDLSIQTIAASCLDSLVHVGNPMAVEFLLDFCSTHGAEHTTQFVWRLSVLKDERVVPTLIDMLERGRQGGGFHATAAAFGGLAASKDPRALEPIRELLAEQPCLGSQLVGSEFHKMPGAESVVPHLLRGMMEAPKLPVVSIGVGRKDRDEALAMAAANSDCRRKLRLLIEKIGGTQLPGQLVKILHDTPAGEGCRAGLDVGLLQLMEEFPDPAAQPLLRRLLESPNHLTRLHAARVLGRLGDASGVPILLEDMLLDGSPFFEHHEKVGAVLNAIASPQTPPLLVDLYAQSSQAKRRRVLEVIALQDDPVYIAFWESLLDQNDETLVKAASEGIGRIVRTTGREVKSDQIVPGDKVHDSIIALMRWAFRDQAPTPRDGPFEDRDVFAEAGRALVLTSPWQCLVYDSSTDTLRQLEYGNPADNKFIKEARESADVVMSGGQVREFGDYVVVDLQLSPTDYLFRRRDGKCKPIGRCLKSME